MFRPFKSILAALCTGFLVSCTGGEPPPAAQEHADEAAPESQTDAVSSGSNSPRPVQPDHAGIFLRHEGGLIEIRRGQSGDLYPTNADRGFGFSLPKGDSLAVDTRQFVVLSKRLNPITLQLTRMDGYAILPPAWDEEARPENVAWLATYNIPANFQIIDRESGHVEIALNEPLPAGFYVLHDDSFVRSRTRHDVTEFYPFIVVASRGNDMPWANDASRCFEGFYKTYAQSLIATPPDEATQRSLRRCATSIHLLYRTTSNAIQRLQLRHQLLFLNRIPDIHSLPILQRMFDEMRLGGTNLEQWFWEQAQGSILADLIGIYDAITSDSTIRPDDLAPLILYYTGESTAPKMLEMLAWVPFSRIPAPNPYLDAMFEQLTLGEHWQGNLATLLGGLQLHRISSTTRQYPGLAPWQQRLDADIPPVFREVASSLDNLTPGTGIVIGPFLFHDTTDEENLAAKTAILSKRREVSACYRSLERRLGNRSTTLIYEHPLHGHHHHPSSELRDPLDSLHTPPAVDQEFLDCIRTQYESIRLPTLSDAAKIVMFAITLNSAATAPWLR